MKRLPRPDLFRLRSAFAYTKSGKFGFLISQLVALDTWSLFDIRI